jgi:PAS domain S-box-containing protein
MLPKLLTFLGTCIIAYSTWRALPLAASMRESRYRIYWQVLSALTFFFLVAYLAVLFLLLQAPEPPPGATLLATIMFFGAGFVALVFEGVRLTRGEALATSDALHEAGRASERQRFFDISIDMLCIADFNGYFRTLSPQWMEVLGYTMEELLAKPFVDFVHPDDVAATNAEAAKLGEGQQVVHFTNRYRCKDGSWKWLQWSSAANTDEGLIYAIARDITEQQRVQMELQRARDAALESTKAKSQFLANMSHEIRTPMNGVIGMASLLAQTKLDSEQKDYVDTMAHSGEALMALMNDILDFTRIDSNKLTLSSEEFLLKPLIDDILQLLRLKAQKKKLSLDFTIADDTPHVIIGDPLRLRQVLLNLIDNAIKFTEQGSVHLTIEPLREPPNTPLLRFTVTDSGIGIPAEEQDEVFESFSQVDSSTSRKFGGAGLGLAISKRLVEMMGGSISIVSTLGKGSSFTFTVGLVMGSEDTPTEKPPTSSPSPPPAGTRILVAEDNAANRKVLGAMLRRAGYESDIVSNGDQALAALEKNVHYAAMLLDCHMPSLDGYETARRIRSAESAEQHLPIIAVTANAMAGEREKALASGMDDYLVKPVRIEQLRDVLAKWRAAKS